MGRADMLKTLKARAVRQREVWRHHRQGHSGRAGKAGRDPRPDFKVARFNDGVEDIKDLKEGMILEGTVSNVAQFGAFVDLGVHQDGLVHVSQLAHKFVNDAREVVKTGDIVRVKVMEVDVERKRIGLSMKLDAAPANRRATAARATTALKAQGAATSSPSAGRQSPRSNRPWPRRLPNCNRPGALKARRAFRSPLPGGAAIIAATTTDAPLNHGAERTVRPTRGAAKPAAHGGVADERAGAARAQFASAEPALWFRPGARARLLELANAPAHQLTRQVAGISEALVLLGSAPLQTLVSSATLGTAARAVPGINLQQFWRYSLHTAKLARSLAGVVFQNPTAAYTAGLLHGLGELLIHLGNPQKAQSMNTLVLPLDMRRGKIEQRILGYSYTHVSAALAQRWLLPQVVVDALQYQAAPFENTAYEPLAGVIHLAAWRVRGREAGPLSANWR